MNLQLNDHEIKLAIVEYIRNQGVSTVDKDVTVSLTAGRGGNGYRASIDVTDVVEGEEAVVVTTKDKVVAIEKETADNTAKVEKPIKKEVEEPTKEEAATVADDKNEDVAEEAASEETDNTTSLFSK